MGIFNKTTVLTSFADSLSNIKASFRTAYNQAQELNNKIQEDIDSKEATTAELTSKVNESKATQSETQKFMKNLEKFI